MPTKVLTIALIEDGDKVLLRKKPEGSPPYEQTWYIFGAELNPDNQDPEEVLQKKLQKQANIKIGLKEKLDWGTEIKEDHDGIEKFFIYLYVGVSMWTASLSRLKVLRNLNGLIVITLINMIMCHRHRSSSNALAI